MKHMNFTLFLIEIIISHKNRDYSFDQNEKDFVETIATIVM